MASKELPGKLYKYAAFNTNSLRPPDDNREKKFKVIRITCMGGASYFYDGDDIVPVDDPEERKKRYISNLASSIKRLVDLEMEKKGSSP